MLIEDLNPEGKKEPASCRVIQITGKISNLVHANPKCQK